MNHDPRQSPAPQLRVISSHEGLAQDPSGEIAAVVRLCGNLLDAELQFYGRLEALLTELATASLFSTDAATSLSVRIDGLHRQRDEMIRDRARCQRALARVMRRPTGEVRMSELESYLHEDDRCDLRRRRLQLVSRVEGLQRLLRRTDIMLGSRLYLFSDIITALTGQSPSANCYGANGRRENHVPMSVLQAVS